MIYQRQREEQTTSLEEVTLQPLQEGVDLLIEQALRQEFPVRGEGGGRVCVCMYMYVRKCVYMYAGIYCQVFNRGWVMEYVYQYRGWAKIKVFPLHS